MKIIQWMYVYTCATLILFGVAKLYSMFGDSAILYQNDPVFGIQNKHLFIYVGILEIFSGIMIWFNLQNMIRLVYTSVCTVGILVYRLLLMLEGSVQYCPCLGTLTENLNINPKLANHVLLAVVLTYVVVILIDLMAGRRLVNQISTSVNSL